MIKKMRFFSLAVMMAIVLGACAQNPAAQPAGATNTPGGAITATAPVKTPIQQTTPGPVSNEKPPFDLTSIVADVASQAKVTVDQVKLTFWQPVEWRDACLGVHIAKQGCADVITPGFTLLFQAGGNNYAVHTDVTGLNYRLAPDNATTDQLPALSWSRSGGIAGICQNLTVYSTGSYWLRDCKAGQIVSQGVLQQAQIVSLSGLWSRYATFEWNQATPAGGAADSFNDQIKFFGTGTETMTPDDQQKLDATLAQMAGGLPNTTSTGDGSSGITGQVTIGPTCGGPVSATTTTECADQPYTATILVLDSTGKSFTQFTTDSQGRFRVPLQPGSYTLHPTSKGTLPFASDQNIQVLSGQYLTVTIMYDSGMR